MQRARNEPAPVGNSNRNLDTKDKSSLNYRLNVRAS